MRSGRSTIRSRGWGIALDDVGADRDSLALLPLLRPTDLTDDRLADFAAQGNERLAGSVG